MPYSAPRPTVLSLPAGSSFPATSFTIEDNAYDNDAGELFLQPTLLSARTEKSVLRTNATFLRLLQQVNPDLAADEALAQARRVAEQEDEEEVRAAQVVLAKIRAVHESRQDDAPPSPRDIPDLVAIRKRTAAGQAARARERELMFSKAPSLLEAHVRVPQNVEECPDIKGHEHTLPSSSVSPAQGDRSYSGPPLSLPSAQNLNGHGAPLEPEAHRVEPNRPPSGFQRLLKWLKPRKKSLELSDNVKLLRLEQARNDLLEALDLLDLQEKHGDAIEGASLEIILQLEPDTISIAVLQTSLCLHHLRHNCRVPPLAIAVLEAIARGGLCFVQLPLHVQETVQKRSIMSARLALGLLVGVELAPAKNLVLAALQGALCLTADRESILVRMLDTMSQSKSALTTAESTMKHLIHSRGLDVAHDSLQRSHPPEACKTCKKGPVICSYSDAEQCSGCRISGKVCSLVHKK